MPEHARNDAHLPIGSEASLAEGYLEDNRAAFLPTASALGEVAGMPVVALPRGLWANPATTGIAQFTNAHLVSPDTNFDRTESGATGGEYPSPVLDLARTRVESPGGCRNGAEPVREPDTLTFFGHRMPDPVSPDPLNPTWLDNPRMTTYSLFDAYLQRRGKRLLFSLNWCTIDAAARVLLPPAVSYSAGLLEYFFRGYLTALLGDGSFRIMNRSSNARYFEPWRGASSSMTTTPPTTATASRPGP